jgi:hypothetical protein
MGLPVRRRVHVRLCAKYDATEHSSRLAAVIANLPSTPPLNLQELSLNFSLRVPKTGLPELTAASRQIAMI